MSGNAKKTSFIDYTRAFDRVKRDIFVEGLLKVGVPDN